jgi:glycosyltransferase involved in cell wall biosynthesis
LIKKLARIFFRKQEKLIAYEKQNNKVCMVVWNTFVTDARVTKEAMTLISAGKDVTVIAIHEPGKTKENEVKNGIKIHRVSRKPALAEELKTNYLKNDTTLKNKASNSNIVIRKSVQLYRKLNKLSYLICKKALAVQGKLAIKLLINYRFFKAAYKENAGAYQSHDLNTLIPVYLVSRLRGTRLVYDAHEVSTDRAGWKNKRYWAFVEKRLMRAADAAITTNDIRADYFVEHYQVPKPLVIRNMPEYQEVKKSKLIHQVLNLEEGEKIILYQGGIQRERGLENIIKAAQYIENGKVVFIGSGQLKPTLEKMVDELGVKDKVHFINAVPMEELLNYTASADIGLQVLQNTCFNHYSADSNKLYEYLMAGIPVVCSNLPDMKKIIEEEDAGTVVNEESPVDIAKAVNELLADEQRLKQVKENALQSSKKYHWGIDKNQIIKAYYYS